MNIIKPVYAEITNPVLKNQGIAGNPKIYFNSVIQTFISLAFIFGIIWFVYHFIMAGYKMMSSQGDPKKYEEAQHTLLSSLLGLGLVFSVFVVLKVVGSVFGISGLNSLTIMWPSL